MIGTYWDAASQVLRTSLRGTVTLADVTEWRDDLLATVAQLPPGTRYKLLYDQRDYWPGESGAHRAMARVVPEVLATPHVTCVAYAQVALDASPADEHVFTSRDEAEAWLLAKPV